MNKLLYEIKLRNSYKGLYDYYINEGKILKYPAVFTCCENFFSLTNLGSYSRRKLDKDFHVFKKGDGSLYVKTNKDICDYLESL